MDQSSLSITTWTNNKKRLIHTQQQQQLEEASSSSRSNVSMEATSIRPLNNTNDSIGDSTHNNNSNHPSTFISNDDHHRPMKIRRLEDASSLLFTSSSPILGSYNHQQINNSNKIQSLQTLIQQFYQNVYMYDDLFGYCHDSIDTSSSNLIDHHDISPVNSIETFAQQCTPILIQLYQVNDLTIRRNDEDMTSRIEFMHVDDSINTIKTIEQIHGTLFSWLDYMIIKASKCTITDIDCHTVFNKVLIWTNSICTCLYHIYQCASCILNLQELSTIESLNILVNALLFIHRHQYENQTYMDDEYQQQITSLFQVIHYSIRHVKSHDQHALLSLHAQEEFILCLVQTVVMGTYSKNNNVTHTSMYGSDFVVLVPAMARQILEHIALYGCEEICPVISSNTSTIDYIDESHSYYYVGLKVVMQLEQYPSLLYNRSLSILRKVVEQITIQNNEVLSIRVFRIKCMLYSSPSLFDDSDFYNKNQLPLGNNMDDDITSNSKQSSEVTVKALNTSIIPWLTENIILHCQERIHHTKYITNIQILDCLVKLSNVITIPANIGLGIHLLASSFTNVLTKCETKNDDIDETDDLIHQMATMIMKRRAVEGLQQILGTDHYTVLDMIQSCRNNTDPIHSMESLTVSLFDVCTYHDGSYLSNRTTSYNYYSNNNVSNTVYRYIHSRLNYTTTTTNDNSTGAAEILLSIVSLSIKDYNSSTNQLLSIPNVVNICMELINKSIHGTYETYIHNHHIVYLLIHVICRERKNEFITIVIQYPKLLASLASIMKVKGDNVNDISTIQQLCNMILHFYMALLYHQPIFMSILVRQSGIIESITHVANDTSSLSTTSNSCATKVAVQLLCMLSQDVDHIHRRILARQSNVISSIIHFVRTMSPSTTTTTTAPSTTTTNNNDEDHDSYYPRETIKQCITQLIAVL